MDFFVKLKLNWSFWAWLAARQLIFLNYWVLPQHKKPRYASKIEAFMLHVEFIYLFIFVRFSLLASFFFFFFAIGAMPKGRLRWHMELVKELNPFCIKLEIVDHFVLESDHVFEFSASLGTYALPISNRHLGQHAFVGGVRKCLIHL